MGQDRHNAAQCSTVEQQQVITWLLLVCASLAISTPAVAAAAPAATTCRLVLRGFGSSLGVADAKLDCTGARPLHIAINSTHLGRFVEGWTGVRVVDKACEVAAPTAIDFLQDQPDEDSQAPEVSSVDIYPLLCFAGDHKIDFPEALIESIWLDYDSVTRASYTTALVAFGGSVAASLQAASIQDNRAGSPLIVHEGASVSVEQASRITGNHAVLGGAAAVWGTAALHVAQGSDLTRNSAQTLAGAAYAAGSSKLAISDSTLHGNSATTGGALYLSGRVLAHVRNTILSNNTARVWGAVLEGAGAANITFAGGACEGNTAGDWGGCMDLMESSHTVLTQGFQCLKNKASRLGGCASTSGSASLVLTSGTVLEGNQAYSGGGIYSEGYSRVHVNNSKVLSNTATTTGGGLWAMDSAIITISSSILQGNAAEQGGGAHITPSANATIERSSLMDNSATKQGGGVAAVGADSLVTIQQSSITNSSAALGGGLYIGDAAALAVLSGCNISDNHARFDGGGLYISATSALNMSGGGSNTAGAVSISANTAGRFGGGILLSNPDTSLANIQSAVEGNSAAFDSDISVMTTSLALVGPPTINHVSQEGVMQGLKLRLRVSGLFGLGNGGMLVQAVLAGEEDQILGVAMSDNSGLVALNIDFQKPRGCYNITFSLVLNVDLTHYTDDIEPVTQQVCVRACSPGEVTVASGDACEVCQAGTFSLNPANNTCDPCPPGAVCPGKATIVPLPGHWHSSPHSPQVHRCPNPAACQGNRTALLTATTPTTTHPPCGLNASAAACNAAAQSAELYTNQQCTPGYSGNLCGVCDAGFGSTRHFVCSKCLPAGAVVALIVVGALAMLALMRLQVHWTLAEAPSADYTSDPVRRVDLVKALVLYAQYLLMVLAINTSWPSSVLLAVQTPLAWLWSTVSSQTLSIQCVLPHMAGSIPPALLNQMFYVITPIVMVLLLLLMEAAVRVCGRRLQSPTSMLQRFVSTALVVVFFCLPFITRTVFSMFACVPIDNPAQQPYVANAVGSYWLLDMNHVCYTGYHRGWAFGLGLPLLVLVCMLPTGIATLLLRHRIHLNNPCFQRSYGFLFRSYRSSVCWWEAVVVVQTLVLVVISVFGQVLGPYLQGLVMFAGLAGIGLLLLIVRPHANPEAGRMMLLGIGCLLLTSYASLLLVPSGSGLNVTPVAAEVIGAGVLAANAAYVVLVVARLVSVVRWGHVHQKFQSGVQQLSIRLTSSGSLKAASAGGSRPVASVNSLQGVAAINSKPTSSTSWNASSRSSLIPAAHLPPLQLHPSIGP